MGGYEVRAAGQNFLFNRLDGKGRSRKEEQEWGRREGTSTGEWERYTDERHGTYLSVAI